MIKLRERFLWLVLILSLNFFAIICEANTPSIIHLHGTKITVAFKKFDRLVSNQEVVASIEKSAEPVIAYYGKFPVKSLAIEVRSNTHHKNGFFGMEYEGKRISYFIGSNASAKEMMSDGILTHEMFHLGFPSLDEESEWMEEGLATYLAFLSRTRLGQISENDFWYELRDGFQDAVPRIKEQGLNSETRYRRKYWGGVFFWLGIDLEIRETTKGKKTLDTVTRAIVTSKINNGVEWSRSWLKRKVDQEAGFPLFEKHYARLGPQAFDLDLDSFWKKLGIKFTGKILELSDNALLAGVRGQLCKPLVLGK